MTDQRKEIEHYYDKKIKVFGSTPAGVDWNGHESQSLRFKQLSKLINNNHKFSLLDIGCGYGALINYLELENLKYSYVGLDLSAEMIKEAQKNHPNHKFIHGSTIKGKCDYALASGIFNVKQHSPNQTWLDFILKTLNEINIMCTQGFAFNCLTKFSDKDKMKDYLYYADPCELFNYCKLNFSSNVALLHDYNLYEFTIIVRK